MVIETVEGPTYPGAVRVHIDDSSADDQSLFIPVGFRYLKSGAYYTVAWQSSSAATPKRIVFQDSPEFSFDLPSQQGDSISFPFDSPPIAFKSFSSLENTFMVNDPAGIVVTFTGRCANKFEFGLEEENPFNPYDPSWDAGLEQYLEMTVVNNNQFYEKTIEISFPSYIFTRDGTVARQC